MIKTYTFFNNANLKLSANKKTVTLDYFSTINNASLSWSVSSGFKNIRLNNTIISSTNSSGQINVTNQVKNGQGNSVSIDNDLFSIPLATVTLSVDGYLANFDIVKVQNETFVTAYNTGQITENEFRSQMMFQNTVAQSMLANSVITSTQYQTLVNILLNALPNKTVNTNNNSTNNTSTNNGGNNDAVDEGFLDWLLNIGKSKDDSAGDDSADGHGVGGVKGWFSAKNVVVGGLVVFVLIVVFAVILRGGGKE